MLSDRRYFWLALEAGTLAQLSSRRNNHRRQLNCSVLFTPSTPKSLVTPRQRRTAATLIRAHDRARTLHA